MPLIMGGTAMMAIENNRRVWIDGRVGGGKTALGVMVGHYLLRTKKVRYFLSNIPVVFADRMEDVKPRFENSRMTLDCAVMLDEAGIFLERQGDTEYMQFLRKLNVIFIMPSVKPVATNLRDLVIQRKFNAQTLGLPLWIYNYFWRTRNGRDVASFVWHHPDEIYGLYDTDAMPLDDGGISDFFDYWTPYAVDYYKKQRQKRIDRFKVISSANEAIRKPVSKMEGGGRQADSLSIEEEIFRLEEISEDISISLGKVKKNKRLRF